MSLLLYRFALDVALFILIWMTQLVVYPTFTKMEESNAKQWHPNYTIKISYLAAPLMLMHLGVAAWQLYIEQSLYTIFSAAAIIATFLITFFQAVPLHNQVELPESSSRELFQKLLKINASRTIIYSLLLLLTIMQFA
jgi:hypothetical protein